MKVSEIPKYKGEIFAFFKFTSYIDSLRKGNLYMNNLEYYVNLAKESGEKGVGDILEAAQVFTEMGIKFYNQEINELILEGESSMVHSRLHGQEKTPVFCLFALDADSLDIVREEEEAYIAKINIPDEQIQKMIEEFGEEMLFINPAMFIERIQNVFNEKKYSYRAGKVIYDNYNVNSSKRIKSYIEQGNDIYFWKDKFFENQKEYRIVITNLEINDPLIVDIGDISDISTPYKASDFFNKELEIHIKK